jgi:hypothetical protein
MNQVAQIDEYGGNPFSTKKSATLQEQIILLQEEIKTLKEQISTLQEVPIWVKTKEAAAHMGMTQTSLNQKDKKEFEGCYKWVSKNTLRWNLRALDRLDKKKKKKSDD